MPLYGLLLKLNERLASIRIKEIKMPDQNIMKDIFDHLTSVVEEETQDRKVRLATIIDLRTKGDILRELAATAAIRTVYENNFTNIAKVEYDAKDVKFIKADIKHFVEFKINPMFVEEWSKPIPSRKRLKQHVRELILEFLADGSEKSRREIVIHILSKMKVSVATIDASLKEMTRNGNITSTKHGFYKK